MKWDRETYDLWHDGKIVEAVDRLTSQRDRLRDALEILAMEVSSNWSERAKEVIREVAEVAEVEGWLAQRLAQVEQAAYKQTNDLHAELLAAAAIIRDALNGDDIEVEATCWLVRQEEKMKEPK